MKARKERYVNMSDVIGDIAFEYNLPLISFDDLITIGKRVVLIYNLDQIARRITFDMLCTYIRKYLETPFGRRALQDLIDKYSYEVYQ